jgi:hypothetical protein
VNQNGDRKGICPGGEKKIAGQRKQQREHQKRMGLHPARLTNLPELFQPTSENPPWIWPVKNVKIETF